MMVIQNNRYVPRRANKSHGDVTAIPYSHTTLLSHKEGSNKEF